MDARDRIQIRVSDDGLEAWLTIAPGDRGDAAAFRERLAELGVVAGLDEKTLDDAARAYASEAGMKQERRIAQGTPPTPADPPRLELQDPAGPIAGTRREDGSLDFRERQLILPVRRDDVLGRIVAATEGKPGLDVHGDPIEPEPPAELVVKHGEGVAIDDEGQLLAVRDGARTLGPDGTIDVVAHHVHPGHVDLKSGNLTTRGSLEIKRDVTANMHVRAGFDLRVGGTVDGARVEAGGSIEIGAGVIGREGGTVRAGGDLSVRHALGARLECGGLLRVTRSVSTSTLVAREIEVEGHLLGDAATAELRIVANEIGSKAGGPCVLRVAWPLENDAEGGAAPAGSVPAPDHARSVTPVVAPTARAARQGSLRARKGGPGRISRGARALAPRESELARRIAWRRRQRDLQADATIEVHGTAHAGCRLDFGIMPLVLERDQRARRWRLSPERDRILCEEL
ncbi:MAG: DUF342 domain-containing protein [Myxococcales bacterium]|nr:DUF342 domain-containing protein [Myxococcales bacterium]